MTLGNDAASTAPPLLVVALGGNAIQSPGGDDSVESDFERTMQTAESLAALAAGGRWRLVITHGNGPQVGNHLFRSELAYEDGGLPLLPLEVCVADTQGGMGYMLQQCLGNAFHRVGVPAVVASVVTQVLVDPDDPAFAEPSKPVGEFIPEDRVESLRARGWALKTDPKGRWRRVVASPRPIEIVEAGAIRSLVDDGVVAIAAGGGGVPVAQDPGGVLAGVAAVVDKDLASALLAIDLRADGLLIVTDVESVFLDYGSPDERALDRVTVDEARAYMEEGQFASGSMGPKVDALCWFARERGAFAAVTSIESATSALEGTAGTRVVG